MNRQQIAHREGLRCVFAFPVVGVASTVSDEGASDQDIPSITTVTGVIELFREQIEPPDEQMLNAATSMGFQLGVFLESRRANDAVGALGQSAVIRSPPASHGLQRAQATPRSD